MTISKLCTVRAGAAMSLIFFTSMAQAETYSCTLKDSRNSGWLPSTLVFQINSDETMAKTYDPITYSSLNGFAEAWVQTENSVRVVLKWSTGRYRNDREMLTRDMPLSLPTVIHYRATLLRGGNKILVHADPESLRDRFSAQGACTETNAPITTVVRP